MRNPTDPGIGDPRLFVRWIVTAVSLVALVVIEIWTKWEGLDAALVIAWVAGFAVSLIERRRNATLWLVMGGALGATVAFLAASDRGFVRWVLGVDSRGVFALPSWLVLSLLVTWLLALAVTAAKGRVKMSIWCGLGGPAATFFLLVAVSLFYGFESGHSDSVHTPGREVVLVAGSLGLATAWLVPVINIALRAKQDSPWTRLFHADLGRRDAH